ncbi:hypothetical protein [Mesoterricola silvestris]|uniref:PEGA domain-containing protein n=1 Tax=Mesoterricola silvestris TaxID=2927979 RepID=A0AA48GJW4_9BACT|nr:hypothetical protein [Mesoterricola silvestris]BDU72672.1 hypothetical protein METEAL_18460 [Mesoterricola silvestris]
MMGFPSRAALAGCVILAAGLACGKPKAIKPSKPVPAGTVLLQFTKKVDGPVDLTIDGIRIPVQQTSKKCKRLTITGLAAGKHHLVLLSALDAFGPDQIDIEVTPGQGVFQVLFSQQFKAVLYGKPEPTPQAEGIPGVVARLES